MCHYRVSRTWKSELDTLRTEQTAQFVDFTEFIRQFDRAKNTKEKDDQDSDDRSVIRSWLKPDRELYSRCRLLASDVASICYKYSVVKNGMVVVKFDEGFDYDSYNAGLYCNRNGSPLVYELFNSAMTFREADLLIFVDSVMPHSYLFVCSMKEGDWRTIRLFRTTVHAGDICQHLIQPLAAEAAL